MEYQSQNPDTLLNLGAWWFHAANIQPENTPKWGNRLPSATFASGSYVCIFQYLLVIRQKTHIALANPERRHPSRAEAERCT